MSSMVNSSYLSGHGTSRSAASGCDAIIDRDAYRSGFLRFVINAPPGPVTLKAHVERNIVWADADDYARQLQQVRDEIDTGF
jgi:hypothetical protein